jgi:hypothetical protein
MKECDKPIISVIANSFHSEFSILGHNRNEEEFGKTAHDLHGSSIATKTLWTVFSGRRFADHRKWINNKTVMWSGSSTCEDSVRGFRSLTHSLPSNLSDFLIWCFLPSH